MTLHWLRQDENMVFSDSVQGHTLIPPAEATHLADMSIFQALIYDRAMRMLWKYIINHKKYRGLNLVSQVWPQKATGFCILFVSLLTTDLTWKPFQRSIS